METKTIFGILFVGLFLVLAVSFVLAANGNAPGQVISDSVGVSDTDTDTNTLTNNLDKNMTYGTCVAQYAKQKNACYKTTKTNADTCGKNAVKDKTAKTNCRNGYKDSMDSCKKSYKDLKVDCKQYKKTFMDKVKFWM